MSQCTVLGLTIQIEARILIFPGTDFHFPSTSVPPGTFFRLWCRSDDRNCSQPLYLSELISHYLPFRSLRSSNTYLLTRPLGITSNFSSWACSASAPSTWNALPAHIRSIDTLSTFKRHLKSHLFQSAFRPTVYSTCASASDSFSQFLLTDVSPRNRTGY